MPYFWRKKQRKRIGTLFLAEEVIQHIQSFMSGKEAARSAILSKSWYHAWLSRPTIDFFCDRAFAEKTIQRYQDSNLFRQRRSHAVICRFGNLIANAMEIGAAAVRIRNPSPIIPTRMPNKWRLCNQLLEA